MSELKPEQIHAMCGYLQERCHKCPREIDTAYGRGTQGCFAIAEETLQKAAKIISPSQSEVSEERIAELIACIDGPDDMSVEGSHATDINRALRELQARRRG